MKLRKVTMGIVAMALAMTMLGGCATKSAKEEAKEPEATQEDTQGEPDSKLVIADNSVDFAANMKFGWNLGNTLDAIGAKDLTSETSWGQPMVTKELLQYVKESGFSTIRIPVSWGNHTDENYQIDEAWMARVKEIVDEALDAGLYVILNSHHDNDYYYPTVENFDNAVKYLTTIWTQISKEFKDYDERLVFEAMNEPRLSGTSIEWWFQSGDKKGCDAIDQICLLDQVFVDVIREGEGYNQSRFLMVPSYAASPDFTLHKNFRLANDPANRLMVSIHAYSPYDFAMNAHGYDAWEGDHSRDLAFINNLKANFVDKGVGVVIGEFGATNKGNDAARVAWAKDYTGLAASCGIPCILWDNGGTDIGEENFGMIDRNNLKIFYPELLAAYLEGYQ